MLKGYCPQIYCRFRRTCFLRHPLKILQHLYPRRMVRRLLKGISYSHGTASSDSSITTLAPLATLNMQHLPPSRFHRRKARAGDRMTGVAISMTVRVFGVLTMSGYDSFPWKLLVTASQ